MKKHILVIQCWLVEIYIIVYTQYYYVDIDELIVILRVFITAGMFRQYFCLKDNAQ